MEFRKMVAITLYMRQQKRHWCIEQSFGLFGRGRGWDDLGEWHWNMYNIIYETSRQSIFDARYWMLGAGALGRPRGMVWGGRREEGSRWGTHVCLWRIHFDIWQNQYNIVKFKNKIKINYILKKRSSSEEQTRVGSCWKENLQEGKKKKEKLKKKEEVSKLRWHIWSYWESLRFDGKISIAVIKLIIGKKVDYRKCKHSIQYMLQKQYAIILTA